MISRICGKIRRSKESSILIDVNGICYEVLIPSCIMQAIQTTKKNDETVELVTFHYYQIDPSRSIPVLVGFSNEVEREFFEQFITVAGIGPKAAVRALTQPISNIAKAIDLGDFSFLEKLPGIGAQRAREIVAKLQGKVGKFGLIQDGSIGQPIKVREDIESEALEILLQLQYKRPEAKSMIQKALKENPNINTAEELLNEVYKQKIR